MSDQLDFGFRQIRSPYGVRVVTPTMAPSDATKRLAGQNLAILERLQRGPATNRELSGLSLKYTSRISDIRAAGYKVICDENRSTGLAVYRLVEE